MMEPFPEQSKSKHRKTYERLWWEHHEAEMEQLVWVVNVATFAVWYWEIDGGGPGRRYMEGHVSDDLLFSS